MSYIFLKQFSVIQDSAKWYEDTLAGSKISYLYLDQNKPEILK